MAPRSKSRSTSAAIAGSAMRPDGTKWSGRPGRRLSGRCRELAGGAPRSQTPRDARAPVLAIGDGTLGFWAAVREVWPETAEQRCWVHRITNVLDRLPKALQPRAKQALHAMLYAETRTACEREIQARRVWGSGTAAGHPQAAYATWYSLCARRSESRCDDGRPQLPAGFIASPRRR